MTTNFPALLNEACARFQAVVVPEFTRWLEQQPRNVWLERAVRDVWLESAVWRDPPEAADEDYCRTLSLQPELRRSHREQAMRLLDRMLSFETQEVAFWTRTIQAVVPHEIACAVVGFALNPPLARTGEAGQTRAQVAGGGGG